MANYIMGLSSTDNTTTVNIALPNSIVVRRFTVGALNLLFAADEEIKHNFAKAFAIAHIFGYPIKKFSQICIGIAGFQNNINGATLAPAFYNVLRKHKSSADVFITSNEQIALAGALGSTNGVILIINNHSVCFGQSNAGTQHKVGGLGLFCDDDGSAFAIGREILRAVTKASDGRGAITHLSALLFAHLSITGNLQLIQLLRENSFSEEVICDMADILPAACQRKDRVALNIVDIITNQLVEVVKPVISRARLQNGTLAVAGPVLLNNSYIGTAFKNKLHALFPDVTCVPPQNDSATGAVLLARDRLLMRTK